MNKKQDKCALVRVKIYGPSLKDGEEIQAIRVMCGRPIKGLKFNTSDLTEIGLDFKLGGSLPEFANGLRLLAAWLDEFCNE